MFLFRLLFSIKKNVMQHQIIFLHCANVRTQYFGVCKQTCTLHMRCARLQYTDTLHIKMQMQDTTAQLQLHRDRRIGYLHIETEVGFNFILFFSCSVLHACMYTRPTEIKKKYGLSSHVLRKI